jgi:hypothetical protein
VPAVDAESVEAVAPDDAVPLSDDAPAEASAGGVTEVRDVSDVVVPAAVPIG